MSQGGWSPPSPWGGDGWVYPDTTATQSRRLTHPPQANWGPYSDRVFHQHQGGCPPGAMKQPSSPRVTTVPWIRVQGLEVLLLVTKTIMESTTYVVGTGSPSMAKGGGGMTGYTLSIGEGLAGAPGLIVPTHEGGQVSIQSSRAAPLVHRYRYGEQSTPSPLELGPLG